MKILVVEDNINLSNSLKQALNDEGYAVDVIHDGSQALRHIMARPVDIDLIMLDVMLPGMSGLDICSSLRSEEITTPILMLTARDTVSDKVAGLDAGADDYVIKPFSLEELLARVRALLRRPVETTDSVLRAGNIVLNSYTKQVTVDGVPIMLSFREFGILEYFMRNPNQIVTREQIIQRVWEHDFDSLSNVVDAHIKNLRKKLVNTSSGISNENTIETIRGMGYRLRS